MGRRSHRGASRLIGQQGDLPHYLAGADLCEIPLAAARDLERAVDDHEYLTASLALAHHHHPLVEGDLLRETGDIAQVLLRALSKERNAPQQLDLVISPEHHPSSL